MKWADGRVRPVGPKGTVVDVGDCGWVPCKNEVCVEVKWDGSQTTMNHEASRLVEC